MQNTLVSEYAPLDLKSYVRFNLRKHGTIFKTISNIQARLVKIAATCMRKIAHQKATERV